MKKQICIMIECENNKNIFTNKKNLVYIVEFAKNFKLKIHYAKTEKQNIVSLERVAKCYCDQTYQSPTEYKIIKKDILLCKEDRNSITTKAKNIRTKIANLIIKNKKITFKQIQSKFEKENISISALSNHFTYVRQELATQGIHVVKIKNGIYEVQAGSKKPAS